MTVPYFAPILPYFALYTLPQIFGAFVPIDVEITAKDHFLFGLRPYGVVSYGWPCGCFLHIISFTGQRSYVFLLAVPL